MRSVLYLTAVLCILGSFAADVRAQNQGAIGFDRNGALHIGVIDESTKMNTEVVLEFYVKTHHWRIQRQLNNRGWESKLPTVKRNGELTDVAGMVGFSTYKWQMNRADSKTFEMNWSANTTRSAKEYSALNEVGMILRLEQQDNVRLSINGRPINYVALAQREALPSGSNMKEVKVEFPSGESFVLTDFTGVSKWAMGSSARGTHLTIQSKVTKGTNVKYGASIRTNADKLVQVDSDAFKFQNSHDGWFAIHPPKSSAFVDTPSFNFADASSAVLDAPAGKYGFLQARDGGFYFEKSPKRVRFNGVTLVHGSKFPTKREAELMAERVAAMGSNCVRMHHIDYYLKGFGLFDRETFDTSTENLDAELFDRMDYLIAQFKKRGIYIHMDGLTYRVFRKGDGVPEYDKLTFGMKGTAYLHDHPVLSVKQKDFLTKVWTHKNPYTGLAYKDDPAIVTAEIVNENDLFTHASFAHHFPPTYREHFKGMFDRWRDRLGLGNVAYGDAPMFMNQRFRMETMREYFAKMHAHLREIGLKIPITGTNWLHPGTPIGVYAAHTDMDYTADHPYGGDQPYRQNPYGPQSRAGLLSLSKIRGKPVMHNEWIYGKNVSGITRAASILYQMALMSSAGHDASYLFSLFHNKITYDAYHINTLNVGWDPAVRALLPAATVMMIRGDMSEPPFEVVYTPPMEKILHSENARGITRDDFDLHLPGFSQAAFKASASLDYSKMKFGQPETSVESLYESKGETGPVKVAAGSDEMLRLLGDPQEYPALNATGELVSYWKEGYFVVKTPRSKWAIGYLPGNTPIDLGDGVSITLEEEQFACVTITSLNEKSVVAGDRLMVATVSYVEQPGLYFDRNWNNPKGLEVQGTFLCKPIKAMLTLPPGAGYASVTGKNHEGRAVATQNVSDDEASTSIPLNQQVLVYEVTR